MSSMSHNLVSRNAKLFANEMIDKYFALQSYMQMFYAHRRAGFCS
jgi:hypothetical protein